MTKTTKTSKTSVFLALNAHLEEMYNISLPVSLFRANKRREELSSDFEVVDFIFEIAGDTIKPYGRYEMLVAIKSIIKTDIEEDEELRQHVKAHIGRLFDNGPCPIHYVSPDPVDASIGAIKLEDIVPSPSSRSYQNDLNESIERIQYELNHLRELVKELF